MEPLKLIPVMFIVSSAKKVGSGTKDFGADQNLGSREELRKKCREELR